MRLKGNHEQAARLPRNAASRGHREAMVLLGQHYPRSEHAAARSDVAGGRRQRGGA